MLQMVPNWKLQQALMVTLIAQIYTYMYVYMSLYMYVRTIDKLLLKS